MQSKTYSLAPKADDGSTDLDAPRHRVNILADGTASLELGDGRRFVVENVLALADLLAVHAVDYVRVEPGERQAEREGKRSTAAHRLSRS